MDTHEILALLESANPQERVLGMGLLMQAEHPNALEIIEALYDVETDPRAKAVAHRAVQTLRQQLAAIEFELFNKPRPAAKKGTGSRKEEGNPAKARRLMHQAVAAMEMIDYMQAQSLVYEAFELDPEMRYDETYLQDAAEIFGTTKQGVRVLLFREEPMFTQSQETILSSIHKTLARVARWIRVVFLE